MMRDRNVRSELLRRLKADHAGEADTRIIDELGLRHGLRRVDVAVVNGSLHGYEIKSDSDTLDRLEGQVSIYSSVLDFATLVVGEKHFASARGKIPKWWGLTVAHLDQGERVKLVPKRKPQRNRGIDPLALVELLWRPEAADLLLRIDAPPRILRSPRATMYRELVEGMEFEQLKDAVRLRLKMRTGWRDRAQPSLYADSFQPRPTC